MDSVWAGESVVPRMTAELLKVVFTLLCMGCRGGGKSGGSSHSGSVRDGDFGAPHDSRAAEGMNE